MHNAKGAPAHANTTENKSRKKKTKHGRIPGFAIKCKYKNNLCY